MEYLAIVCSETFCTKDGVVWATEEKAWVSSIFDMLTAIFELLLELLQVKDLGLKILRGLMKNVLVAAYGSYKPIL